MVNKVEFKNVAVGSLATLASYFGTWTLLEKLGVYKWWTIRDTQGREIWSIGNDDLINLGAAGATTLLGKQQRKTQMQEVGLSWLLTYGTLKASELFDYYVKVVTGTIGAPKLASPKSQAVSTGGTQQTYRPRTSYRIGNAGSAREIENHVRGEALTPKTWVGTYGSVPQTPTGTFNGVSSGLTVPEEVHVTPQLEQALAQSVQRRQWAGGGSIAPVQGTFE